MPDFRYDWFTGNIAGLTTLLERFAGKPNIHAIEIGPFEGRSTLWFLGNILTHGSSSITCVDHFKGSKDHEHFKVDVSGARERFEANTEPFNHRIKLFDSSSGVALRYCRSENDFIYIDGSHLAADVLQDAVMSWPLLKIGGILIFDDYLWRNMPEPLDNPYPGIDAFLAVYKGKYKELARGYQIAIEKI